jgi:phospholipase C
MTTRAGSFVRRKWGWFQGGFRPTVPYDPSKRMSSAVCGASSTNGSPASPEIDYVPHHEPFQYFQSTANPHHIRPSSVDQIGRKDDQANHQYDLRISGRRRPPDIYPQ